MTSFLNLTDSANWTFVFQGTFTQDAQGDPIASQLIGTTLDSHYLACGTNSSSAKTTWYLGCWLQPILEANTDDFKSLYLPRISVPINGATFINVLPYTPTYSLKVYFPKWIKDLELLIYKYIGENAV
jgi:hypothetical protein